MCTSAIQFLFREFPVLKCMDDCLYSSRRIFLATARDVSAVCTFLGKIRKMTQLFRRVSCGDLFLCDTVLEELCCSRSAATSCLWCRLSSQ